MRFYHNICIFDAFLSVSLFPSPFVFACLSIFHILILPHVIAPLKFSSFAQHTCCCLLFQRLCNALIPFNDWSLFACLFLCVCATHCTQCCAYWMHLPRCTLNELWLLMNGGTVEERTKNSMIIHRNWPSPRYYCVLEFSFVFFSCSFSFIYFHFFSLFLHFVQPTKMANSIEKKN